MVLSVESSHSALNLLGFSHFTLRKHTLVHSHRLRRAIHCVPHLQRRDGFTVSRDLSLQEVLLLKERLHLCQLLPQFRGAGLGLGGTRRVQELDR